MSEKSPERAKNVRGTLRHAADNADEAIVAVLTDAMQAEKTVNAIVTCKHCFKQGSYPVEVKDHTNAIKAVDKLVELGYGRAQSEPQGEDTTVTEVRALTDEELLARRVSWLRERGWTVERSGEAA